MVFTRPIRRASRTATGYEKAERRPDQKNKEPAAVSDKPKWSNSHSASIDWTKRPPPNESRLNNAAKVNTTRRDGPSGPLGGSLTGVVSAFAPVDRRRFGYPAMRSGGLQDAERYRGSAHMLPTPRCRRNTLAHAGPATQEVSELVVTAAIPSRRSSALQSKHRSTSAFDAAVILLKSVVQIAICPM